MGKGSKLEEDLQRVFYKYESEKKEVDRLLKTFIGVAANPGTTYNIQNAFHSQGYFGVKVTPLGANLALLEGQEEGEVEALLEDARDWLDQWFSEIRPWTPKDVDLERTVWLRIFGIPVHAWNDEFFAQITKPWGTFMHADDVTSKKLSMDVARLFIRTSCQKAVDEFINVQVNGEIFRLRVLEDSYGPIREMVPQNKGQDGRASSRGSSEADEEEEEARLAMVVEEESEREDGEEQGENLLALNVEVIANNDHLSFVDHGENLIIDKERIEVNSNLPFNTSPNVEENLNSGGCGTVGGRGGVNDLFNVENDILLG
jgi:hypothetical protein